jgi:hypothetical protein
MGWAVGCGQCKASQEMRGWRCVVSSVVKLFFVSGLG